MATFTVWKFDDPEAAGEAATILRRAASDGLITVVDHAVVSWPVGQATPTTRHTHDDRKRGTGWGAFWGLHATLVATDLTEAERAALLGTFAG